MNIIAVGIDLAKTLFAVHGVDDTGRAVLVKPKVSRADLLPLVASLPQSVSGFWLRYAPQQHAFSLLGRWRAYPTCA